MERVLRKVPDHVIAEIRDRVDLVELIGAYVTLKRSGKNHMGLCPFHQERTPSFNVSPDRGIYHCFGCGVTGDGIRFLMEHDNLSFQEALRNMAQRAGVDLSPFEGRGDGVAHDYDQLYAAHAIAARLYEKLLRGKEGEAARAEIRRRGYAEEIVTQYRLGASADSWDRLLNEARREGIPAEILEKGGLAIRRDGRGEGEPAAAGGGGRGHYDRFRGRLMFPILAVGPKVIAFGGRVLDDGEPKYLNSPESPLFRKRETLYGIPQALPALRETRHAILVEGYTDVLALANVGIRGALAALGTAFSSAHAAWLARSCDRVTVVFDGDAAGRKAAYGSAGPLLGAGLEVRMVMLPPGEDPDSLVRKQGKDGMLALLEAGTEVVPTLCGDEAWESPAGRERAVLRVLDALVPVEDPLRRAVYLESLSELVGVGMDVLERQMAERLRDARRTEERILARERKREEGARARGGVAPVSPGPAAGEDAPPPDAPPPGGFEDVDPDAVPVAAVVSGPPHVAERTFVAIVVHDEALGEGLLEKFGPGDFLHPLTRRIVEKAVEIASSGSPVTVQRLMDAFEEDAAARVFLGELALGDAYTVGIRQQAEDCAVALQRRRMEREKEALITEMRKAKANGEDGRLRELAGRRNELARGLARLTASRTSRP